MFRILGQARPFGRIHVHVLFIGDVLLVEVVHVDLLLAVGGAQELQEVALELVGEVVDVFAGVFADEQHLADVRFGLGVAFEAIFVAGLFFTDLAVPTEALEAFGFELIIEVFGGSDFGFGHDDDFCARGWCCCKQLRSGWGWIGYRQG